jgi:hypothetical protein
VNLSIEVAADLLRALETVPDPRSGGGRRHPLVFVLGVLVASFACSGFESFSGAAQWAAAASPELLLALGATPDPLTGAVAAPSEATIRRVATRVDAAAVEAVVAAWTAAHRPGSDGGNRLAVAIDGKTVRGARSDGGVAPHLLAAATHDRSMVLAQRRVPDKTNEIPLVAALVDDLRAAGHDPAGMVFTLDALHPARHRRPAARRRRRVCDDRQGQPTRPAGRDHRPAQRPATGAVPAAVTRPWPHRGTPHPGGAGRRGGLPRRRPGVPHRPLHRRTGRPTDRQGGRPRHHQPHRRPGRRPAAGRPRPRPLVD